MRGVFALAVAIPLLAGCSVKREVDGAGWTRPNTMYRQITLDEITCERRVREQPAGPEYGVLGVGVGGVVDLSRFFVRERREDDAFSRCMADLGYAPVAGR